MGSGLRIGLTAVWLAVSLPAMGELTVMGSDPGARPAPALLAGLLQRFSAAGEDAPPAAGSAAPQDPGFAGIASKLAPSARHDGTFRINAMLPNPVCVIGSDPISQRWLQRNRERLVAMGARCVLVEVANQRELEKLQKRAQPVPIVAVPFDGVARAIGLQHIPALLTGAGP